MHNQLDNKITAKIREVFDNYEDEHADYGWQELRKKYPVKSLTVKIHEVFDNYEDEHADYGWQELRKKYPVKRRRKPLVLWFSAAAAVLILALGVWIVIPENKQQNITAKTNSPNPILKNQSEDLSKPLSKNVDNAKPASENSDKTTLSVEEGLAQVKRTGLQTTDKDVLLLENDNAKEILLTTGKQSVNAVYSHSKNKNQNKASAPSKGSAVSARNEHSLQNENPFQQETILQTTALTNNPQLADSTSLNTSNPTLQPEASLTQNSPEKEKKRTLLDLALEEDAKKKKKEEKKSDKKVIFGIYAGSFVSYAAGSENKINLGAGFSSDISLTKNLKLSTGVSLAKNDLSYNKNIPTSAQASFQQSIQKPSKIDDVGVLSKGFAPTINVISYNLNHYEVSLLALDIPINLKYSFIKQKNEYFLSAGFSSGTFINESYTYKYSSSGPSYEKLPDTEPVINEGKAEKTFGGFDFARMLNVSFGVGYPLGKQNRLIIEPFLKYPLKDVGAENLRFGAGGVNLKLNFQSSKNKKK